MDKDNEILQQAIDDRIDAFIRGEMTEEEETAFKNEIKADPELRAHVLANISLIKGIREENVEKEKTLIQKYSSDRVRSLVWWACSIAAVFAILFGYSIDSRHHHLSDIVSPYYAQYNIDELSRGDADSTIVIHLYTLFNERNADKIIKELEPIYTNLDKDFTYHAYDNDIAWNLALAYIKDDQIDKAIPVLDKLEKDNPDTPIAAKAKKLLEELKR